MICEWYALDDREAVALVSHPVFGEVPTCQQCIDKHSMAARVVAVLDANDQPRYCIDRREPASCSGGVQWRESLSGTGTSIPRCDHHWSARLDAQRGIEQRYPQHAPADFDPDYAGERWDDDY